MGHIGASKLNEEKVGIIKDLLNTGDYNHKQIGDLFGVSRTLIWKIANGERWNDENKSFVMKSSNDYRQFTDTPKTITGIKILYSDGTELDLR